MNLKTVPKKKKKEKIIVLKKLAGEYKIGLVLV